MDILAGKSNYVSEYPIDTWEIPYEKYENGECLSAPHPQHTKSSVDFWAEFSTQNDIQQFGCDILSSHV